MRDRKEVNILLVEDDLVDAEAIQRAFAKQKIANHMRVVPDGIAALELLREKGGSGVASPRIILLDLNTPRMSGIEFLQTLRADPELRSTIVIVLTTSNHDRDKIAAYDLNVAGYILKSNAGADFINVLTVLDHYWRFFEFPPEVR